MKQLADKAKNVARDMEPKDDLHNLRIRTKSKEIILSHDKEFIVIVIQKWVPYVP